MTENNSDNMDNTQDYGQESPVIKALRQQVKDLERELKARPDRDSLAAELRNELNRDQAIVTQLEGYGHPAGILDTVKSKLGDGEVSAESVASALASIGYTVEAGATSDSGNQAPSAKSDLADVTNLSREVSTAASGSLPDTVLDQIGKAGSQDELVEIAKKAGIVAQHH